MMDDQIFTHLVLSSIGVTSIASPLIEILYNPETRIEKFTRFSKKISRTIQNTPRNSELRIVSCIHKEGEVRSIIALLEAFNPSHQNPIYVYVIHLIELLGRSTPLLRRIDIHKKKSCCVNYPNTSPIMRAFDNFAQNSADSGGDSGCVTVVPCINVAPYKSMHESICNLAYDQSIPLIILPFHQNVDGGRHRAASIVNANFQDYAPCTVGMLVDRNSWLGLSSTSFVSFNVGIFFMGGPDDREALALGMRMSERENMSIVLLRFVLQKEQLIEDDEDDKEERRLDESLIDEFRAMKFGKGHVAFRETAVEEWEKVLEAIRSSKENYDLVIVGRRHKIGGFEDEEMSNFLENTEMLGMLGDMLASAEFCNGVVPVLVVQCGGTRLKKHHRKDICFGSQFWGC